MSSVKKKLKELAEIVNGGTPSTKNSEFYDGDIVWITPKDLSEQRKKYISKGERTITKLGLDSSSATLVPEGTILLSSRAPIGLTSIATRTLCTNQGFKNIVVNKEKLDNEYLYYYIKTRIKEIEALGSGTTFKEVSKSTLENYELTIPERVEEQKKIAKVLSTIDDKIELNNKINSELEAMAKEIYEYWFVQFDFPDENGKPYKSSGGKMVWNEELNREIPEGWEVKKVKNVIQHINTGLNPRQNFKLNDGGNIKYITVKNLTTDGSLNFEGCDLITQKSKDMINQRSQIRKGDILFASIAPLGRCYLMYETPTEWEINESVFSIRSNDLISPEYLYMYFMSKEFIKTAENSSTGSVFNGIRIGTLEDMDVLIPDKKVLDDFSNKIKKIFLLKRNNEKQNNTLLELRNFLLPMLINGQLTVK